MLIETMLLLLYRYIDGGRWMTVGSAWLLIFVVGGLWSLFLFVFLFLSLLLSFYLWQFLKRGN